MNVETRLLLLQAVRRRTRVLGCKKLSVIEWLVYTAEGKGEHELKLIQNNSFPTSQRMNCFSSQPVHEA